MAKRKERRGTKTHKPLAERKRRFVEAFMANGGNATQAAKRAGYSTKTAASQGSRLLRLVDVRHALEAKVRACPIVASKQERQAWWSAVYRGDGPHVLLHMRDRLMASHLLGKSSGDFLTRLELDVSDDLYELLGGRPLPKPSPPG